MAITNRERVGKALDLVAAGLRPFVERELRKEHGPNWETQMSGQGWDAQALLKTMWDQWNALFGQILGQAERTYVSELREWRNKWAHQEALTTKDAERALDTAERLLRSVSAPEAEDAGKARMEALRTWISEQARGEVRKAAAAPIEGQPSAALKPWRAVVTPHPDVASGRFQQAEFTANLGQVHRNEGSDEYRLPREFYRRTYLTDGLRSLLVTGLRRLNGTGGDPVVELQTNFGGGKTHSMLALLHLFSGTPANELPGIEEVLKEAESTLAPKARTAVLDGIALSPANVKGQADGTQCRTLWGVMAWQLLGKEGYSLVSEADAAGVSPGSDALRELFSLAAPCLILIDEWVAYVRQIHEDTDLPAGSYQANITFAQALTEAAKASPRTLVVAAMPQSKIETGGEAGTKALAELKNVFGRVESAWRPASAAEGFEIVRRRLFQPLEGPEQFKWRDAVVSAFSAMYRANAGEFPTGCGEGDYARRMEAAYPIHPELFDRLNTDWASLDNFQRTRGVLRLMAAVIHELWERQDANLLILPAFVPVEASPVFAELTRYIPDPWKAVIDKDVDGPQALPVTLDRENASTLGRYSAARRVARTVFLGSAATAATGNAGLDDRQIRLGCVQPGENPATFGDALRRLADRATHLYSDPPRTWFNTQPSVLRLAQDRAAQQEPEKVWDEIKKRLRVEARGEFAAIHVAPVSPGDVSDDRETRLVVLGPEHPRGPDGRARTEAATILGLRGSGPRKYTNALVFLAPDTARLDDLDAATRDFLAWTSVEDDAGGESPKLNLDTFQRNQARTRRMSADRAIVDRIAETYVWALVPSQTDPKEAMTWEEVRVTGGDTLARRTFKKLQNEQMIVTKLAGSILRTWLDKIPLWEGEHVELRKLADHFAQYVYLPRLRDEEVLIGAVMDGVASTLWETEGVAFADSYDETTARYRGLKAGQLVGLSADLSGLVVHPEIALVQMEGERPKPEPPGTGGSGGTGPGSEPGPRPGPTPPPATPKWRRFHANATLEPLKAATQMQTIQKEVLQHLQSVVGSKVEVRIEIQATVDEGYGDDVRRIVSENCAVLKVAGAFEEE